jgi:hypothetical protein
VVFKLLVQRHLLIVFFVTGAETSVGGILVGGAETPFVSILGACRDIC